MNPCPLCGYGQWHYDPATLTCKNGHHFPVGDVPPPAPVVTVTSTSTTTAPVPPAPARRKLKLPPQLAPAAAGAALVELLHAAGLI